MKKVLILGSNGMLGSMVASVLSREPALETATTTRGGGQGAIAFDAERDPVQKLVDLKPDWIVNAIGVIKPRIDEGDPVSVSHAQAVNGQFPARLAEALRPEQRVIQIATDGVFAGTDGPYDESAVADATGAYATSKRLGEVDSPNFLHLRCSIVGPEPGPPRSLLGWLLAHESGATVPGYTNQHWNGVTSLHFAKLCAGAIRGDLELPSPLHVVPAEAVSKAELLELMLRAFERGDIAVAPQEAEVAADNTLATVHPQANGLLWRAAGYERLPTVAAMLEELAMITAGLPAPGASGAALDG